MPIEYYFDRHDHYFETAFIGEVSSNDFLSAYRDILCSLKYRKGMHELCDCRALTKAHFYDLATYDTLQQMMGAANEGLLRPLQTVIVTDSPSFYGMIKAYDSSNSHSPQQIRVFEDYSQAKRWLEQYCETEEIISAHQNKNAD